LEKKAILCSVWRYAARCPGTGIDLLTAKARGGDVRIVYSPLDAVTVAKENPTREVVFFAVGFETTAPANAMAVQRAQREGVTNFSDPDVACARAAGDAALLLGAGQSRAGLSRGGSRCAIMGTAEYGPIAQEFHAPIIVDRDLSRWIFSEGIFRCVKQLEEGRAEPRTPIRGSCGPRATRRRERSSKRCFEVADRNWRGIGPIPKSGLEVRPELAAFDAGKRFKLQRRKRGADTVCISGEIMRGVKKRT